MKTTNIRELKHATSTVLDWVQQGETVQITRYNKVVGIIVPPSAEIDDIPEVPDFYERLEKLFFDTSKPMTWTELVSYSRGER